MSYFREFWRCNSCFATYLSWIAMPWPSLDAQEICLGTEGTWALLPEPHTNCMGGKLHVVGLYIYTTLDQKPETPSWKLL